MTKFLFRENQVFMPNKLLMWRNRSCYTKIRFFDCSHIQLLRYNDPRFLSSKHFFNLQHPENHCKLQKLDGWNFLHTLEELIKTFKKSQNIRCFQRVEIKVPGRLVVAARYWFLLDGRRWAAWQRNLPVPKNVLKITICLKPRLYC